MAVGVDNERILITISKDLKEQLTIEAKEKNMALSKYIREILEYRNPSSIKPAGKTFTIDAASLFARPDFQKLLSDSIDKHLAGHIEKKDE